MTAVGDFNELIVGNYGGQPIYLKEIASISDSVEEPRSLARLNEALNVVIARRDYFRMARTYLSRARVLLVHKRAAE